MQMMDFKGFFRTFRVAGQVSAQLGGHVSSSTLSAHQMARAGVAAFSSSAAVGVAHEFEHVEYNEVWWPRQWTRLGRSTPGGSLTTMMGAGTAPYGGPSGRSCRGGDVPVIVQKESVPIDSGYASPSLHRQSVGHYRFDTETGTHSAVLGYGVYVPDSASTVEVPQLQFIDSRRHSCCGADANPKGSAHSEKTVDFPQVQFLAWV